MFHALFPLFLPLCHLQCMQICPDLAGHIQARGTPASPLCLTSTQLCQTCLSFQVSAGVSAAHQQRPNKVCLNFSSPACFPSRNACLHKLSPALHILFCVAAQLSNQMQVRISQSNSIHLLVTSVSVLHHLHICLAGTTLHRNTQTKLLRSNPRHIEHQKHASRGSPCNVLAMRPAGTKFAAQSSILFGSPHI